MARSNCPPASSVSIRHRQHSERALCCPLQVVGIIALCLLVLQAMADVYTMTSSVLPTLHKLDRHHVACSGMSPPLRTALDNAFGSLH